MSKSIIIETFDGHIHLSKKDFASLFGEGVKPQVKERLSQPGLFIGGQQVEVKGENEQRLVLPFFGPFRVKTQIEISRQQADLLGICAKEQVSGSKGVGNVTLKAHDIQQGQEISVGDCVIIPAPHLHMPPEDASPYNLYNSQVISVKLPNGNVIEQVTIRISHMFVTRLHLSRCDAQKYGVSDRDVLELNSQFS